MSKPASKKSVTESKLSSSSHREKLDKRISELESHAVSLEERAIYAEREAQLRKRASDARRRIRASQPPGWFDGLSPQLGNLLRRTPAPVKALVVLVTIVTVLLLIGKALSPSG